MSKNNQDEKEMTITDLAQEMREGFKEMRAEFKRVDQRFERMDQRFELVDQRFDRIDQRFTQIDQRFDRNDQRFTQIDQRFDRNDQRVGQGFEALSLKIDAVEEEARAFRTEVMARFSDLEKGLFTEEEKEKVMAMVRHYDHWLEDDTLGTKRITLTREEYDAASFARGFRNRFDNLEAIMVE
jgi:predicted nuclease with TOPRIM domain